ncbi:MAG: hypothetical protein AAGU76_14900 [Sedimentibacter sp.]|uniref:hypothetical protein n=1 Tax=Sedimentibacter sp. TaxID=1960295 RepID=UPI0031580B59
MDTETQKEKEIEREKEKKREKEEHNVKRQINKQDIYQDIINLYNNTCTKLQKVNQLTDKTKVAIDKLLTEFTVDQIKLGFEKINNSSFCIGKNEKGWKADFDFCLKPDKLMKAIEGKYKDFLKGGDNDGKNIIRNNISKNKKYTRPVSDRDIKEQGLI